MSTGAMLRLRQVPLAAALYLFTALLVGFAIDGGVMAVLLNLFLVRLGYGPDVIGLITAAGTVVFALASLPVGALGERWGCKRMLVIGLSLMVLGAGALPLADTVPLGWRLPWLIISMVVLYIGLACYFVNGPPFLMRVVPQDRVSTAFSVQIALLAVSAFAGSLVGGLLPQQVAALIGTTLSDPAAYRYPLLLAAFVLIPGVWAIAVARPIAVSNATADTPVPPTDVPAVSPRAITRLLGLIALVRLLQVSGLAITNTFFNVYLDSALAVPTVQIGMLSAAGRLLAAPAALLAPLLGRRLGNHTTVIVACTGTALCMLPLALVPHWGAAGFGFIGVSALSAVRYASSLVYFLDQVPPNRRSTVMGVTEMAAGFSFAGLTLGGGYLAVTAGYQALFLLGAGITMLGVGVFIVAFPARKAL